MNDRLKTIEYPYYFYGLTLKHNKNRDYLNYLVNKRTLCIPLYNSDKEVRGFTPFDLYDGFIRDDFKNYEIITEEDLQSLKKLDEYCLNGTKFDEDKCVEWLNNNFKLEDCLADCDYENEKENSTVEEFEQKEEHKELKFDFYI